MKTPMEDGSQEGSAESKVDPRTKPELGLVEEILIPERSFTKVFHFTYRLLFTRLQALVFPYTLL